MKKRLTISALILLPLLFMGGICFYLSYSLPSDETIRREFLERNPNAEIVSFELIFDHSPKGVLTYLVKFKDKGSRESLLEDFAVKRKANFHWQWCSDQTDRKC